MMTLSDEQVVAMIAAAITVHDTRQKELEGKIPPLTERKAAQIYGYKNIRLWQESGLVKKTGGRFLLSELEAAKGGGDIAVRVIKGY